MKKILLLAFSCAFSIFSFAQPVGDTFPDFTYNDLDGNTHHLQSYLDAGKIVMIDVFATWCGVCQSSVGGWEQLYSQHGQGGDQSMVLLSFERDPNTSNEEDYVSQFGIESPVITEAESIIDNLWNITYQPRYFVICPDGSFFSQLSMPIYNDPQPLIDLAAGCEIVGLLENEAGISLTLINNGNDDFLTYSSNLTNLTYSIYDLTGAKLTEGRLENRQGELDVSLLTKGVYIISVQSESTVQTLRFYH